jgi:DNA polymerase alpha subunit A
MLFSSTEMMLKRDPDVIVGCDFVKQGADLDIILVRLRDLKVDHWSRIGRLRRPKMPVIKQGYTSQFLSGRLICDLTTEASKVSSVLALYLLSY